MIGVPSVVGFAGVLENFKNLLKVAESLVHSQSCSGMLKFERLLVE